MTQQVDRSRAAQAVRELLLAYGLNPDSERLRATPRRVADSYADLLSGVGADPRAALGEPLPAAEQTGELVLMRDIRFRSACEHHLLPFQGTAHIAYVPQHSIVGLSALPKLVQLCAARPNLQERLGDQIAEELITHVQAEGVLVVLEARHGCLADRGVEQKDARVITLASRGSLMSPEKRTEVFSLIGFSAPNSGVEYREGLEA